jgi:3-oxoadipate enol-lactonase
MNACTDRDFERQGLPRLRYRDDGQGPAVLLVHGWLLDLTMFDSLVPRLVDAGFRVVRWDRRGCGASAGTPSVIADAADALALLERIDAGPYAVLGMSQGCRIALALAESVAHPAACLVLDGPPPIEGLPNRDWHDETPVAAYRQLLHERGIEALRGELARHPLLQLQTDDVQAQARLAALLARYTGADLAMEGAPPGDVPADRFTRLPLPVLVLNGELDTAQRLRVGETLALAIPGATRRLVPASRHLACWDNPAAYARLVTEFLATNRHRWA